MVFQVPTAPAGYCRLSYAPDGSVEKVERQAADIIAQGERLGWPPICCMYSDNNASAWQRNRKRPNWDQLLISLDGKAPHQHDGIIVYHGDRLIRQPFDLELLLRLADDRHLPLASVSGTRDLNDEDDRYILRIEAAGACKSSADTSRRVLRGHAAIAARGRAVGGGKRPFGFGPPIASPPGYDVNRQVAEEVAILRDAADRLLAGETLGRVVAWLNEVSCTTQGNRWTPKAFKQLITSTRVAGLIDYHGQRYEAVWEPVLPVETWEAVRSLLAAKAAEHGYFGRQRQYLLSGWAECSGCGTPVRAKITSSGGTGHKYRLYHCPNPTCRSRVGRNIVHLDAYVEGAVLRRLNEPGFVDELQAASNDPDAGREIAELTGRKAETERTLENLADHPGVSPDLLVKSISSFDRRIGELRGRMAATSRHRLLARMAGITREHWDAEPLDVRAETVRALYRVVILPVTKKGPGFHPESVDLVPLSV